VDVNWILVPMGDMCLNAPPRRPMSIGVWASGEVPASEQGKAAGHNNIKHKEEAQGEKVLAPPSMVDKTVGTKTWFDQHYVIT